MQHRIILEIGAKRVNKIVTTYNISFKESFALCMLLKVLKVSATVDLNEKGFDRYFCSITAVTLAVATFNLLKSPTRCGVDEWMGPGSLPQGLERTASLPFKPNVAIQGVKGRPGRLRSPSWRGRQRQLRRTSKSLHSIEQCASVMQASPVVLRVWPA